MFKYCAYSGKGTGRNANEDRVMVDNMVLKAAHHSGEVSRRFMAVICDGVGSTNGGAHAAERIAKSFENFEIDLCSPLLLSRHLHRVNREIAAEQTGNKKANTMASAAAGLVLTSNRYLLFNLGDTRIYKYHDGKLLLVTKDHTEPSFDNCITSYVGGSGNACFPSFRKGAVENGSMFLMCSDGIYKSIKDEDLKSILGAGMTIGEKERAILKLSLQNGSTDDRSLVLVESVS